MSEFWLWFWRPLAELLGSIAAFFIIILAITVFIFLWALWDKFFGKKAAK